MDTTLKTPFIADIDYLYDFGSIFANPEQEKLFVAPYSDYTDLANLGTLDETKAARMVSPYGDTVTDELIRLLGQRGKA
jgi:S-adenosylmethionine hydrolase